MHIIFSSNASPSVANPPSNSATATAPPQPPSGSGGNNSGPNSVPTPGGGLKPGMHSPMTPEGGPRSNQHGPASVGGPPSAAGPAGTPGQPASASSAHYLNKSLASTDPALNAKAPEASSLVLNLVLSDTLLNVFLDHNFDSCTMCVCNNEGSIRGRDAAVYLPEFAEEDEVNCTCGFSAVANRRLAHQSGLFYEDETEVTSIAEDLYGLRKKASLLLLDPKGGHGDHDLEKSGEVDAIQPSLLELIHRQSSYAAGAPNALAKYSSQGRVCLSSLLGSNFLLNFLSRTEDYQILLSFRRNKMVFI